MSHERVLLGVGVLGHHVGLLVLVLLQVHNEEEQVIMERLRRLPGYRVRALWQAASAEFPVLQGLSGGGNDPIEYSGWEK